jgi:hypothetical protein
MGEEATDAEAIVERLKAERAEKLKQAKNGVEAHRAIAEEGESQLGASERGAGGRGGLYVEGGAGERTAVRFFTPGNAF